ncbi:MAG: peptide ABC transporter substrate-binding protein [Chloroflexota bacterium]|nr:peptide ABC transporter substrate-binding protein [Chloroflexota bacterium]
MSNKLLLAAGGVAAALIIGLAVILIVVANGGGDKKSSDGGDTAANTPSASNTRSSGSSSGPAASGELRLRGDDPLFLDPAVAQDAGSAVYIVEIFSGLVRLDKGLKVQPDVAESWDTSADGKTYTFHLNKKATFQDGRPVSADDVKYSFERALNPDTGSVTAENFLGDIVGAKDVSRGRATQVSGVKVIDDTTLAVTIDAAKPYFLYKLSYPTAFIVDQRQIKSNPSRWSQKPNGTGPYKLKEWKLGEKITLEAYDNNVLGAPKLKTVSYDLTGGSSLVSYEQGDIDVTGIGLDDLDRVQDPSDPLNKEYTQTARQSVDYIGFNTNVKPFDDPLVRQAFAMAVDRKKIAEVVLKGAIPVANGILVPGVPAYTTDDKTYAFDPQKAKGLLAQSKYAGNLGEITLAESGAGATVGPTTEAIVQFWKDNLGVDVKIQQAESGTFFQDIDNGRYQMFHLGWIMDYPDPEDVLDILFYSKSKQNSTRYSNPDIDAKLEAARVEANTEKRLATYQDVEKTLIKDAVWIPMFFDTTHALVKPYVKGYEFPPLIIERFRNVEVTR